MEVITSPGSGDVVLLLEREVGAGLYLASTAERFKLVASGELLKAVRWSANAGSLQPDAEQVTWTLPPAGIASLSVSVETESGKKAEGSFNFNVIASPLVAHTVIDTGPSVTGGTCEFAFDNAGNGHVVYTNDTHNTLWYASWDGTTWKTEQIDGPGFNTGSAFVTTAVLAVDAATGTPHVAYLKGTGTLPSGYETVGYGVRVNGVWVRESLNTAGTTRLGIALNPAQGQQPVIVYASNQAGSIRVATRTAVNSWSTVLRPLATASLNNSDPLFDATGALHLVTTQNDGLTSNYLQVIRGSAIGSFELANTSTYAQSRSVAWGADRHILSLSVAINDGQKSALDDITLGTPLSASTVRSSPVDYKYKAADLAYGGGKPAVVTRTSTTLQLMTPDAQGLWTYTQLGSVDDNTRPSVAIRPTDGTPHVCYQRGSRVSFQ
ncbi:hypothetical protein [Corallococcus sicarius]|uniref:Uncharacterized protein n=1 Tax=Corallococcus sicarius TaxID=2316726 RepID=A0A3A8NSR3_9BACT|nr:hypothetical protein [Corallococcus sicarius]RKH47436.1 hypothetical protein D7X12_02945 [Corallococcus sicarius]